VAEAAVTGAVKATEPKKFTDAEDPAAVELLLKVT
jgi:hypothetical protein